MSHYASDMCGRCPTCGRLMSFWGGCNNPACSANQSSAPSPRSDVGENDLGGGWVPVSERLPEDGDLVAVWDGYSVYYNAFWNASKDAFMDFCHSVFASVSMWHPLPKPPTEVESPEPPSAERGTPAVPEEGCRIYIASKTKHAARWRELRSSGVPIISTWIDEAGPGESGDLSDLWLRCIREASGATAVIVYREPEEVLKGAFVEVGAALASGVPVYAVGMDEFSVVNHPGLTSVASFDDALRDVLNKEVK